MRRSALVMAAAVLVAASGCTTAGDEIPTWRGPSFAHQQQLLTEAEAFIAEYARRLVAGDRAAIANLYAADGAILIRNGRRMNAAHADIVRLYAGTSWQPPARFQWRDLHFEAVGAEAVAVLGGFVWHDADGSTAVGTYHAVLRRENGQLAIRIEDETVADRSRQTPG